MNDDQVRLHFQTIRQQMAALQSKDTEAWQKIDTVLEDLHVICEQMQTNLAIAESVEEEFLQQTQQLTDRCHYYYDLFQNSPIAYLVIDASGRILEANHAIARLLNVPPRYLAGRSLAVYVAESDRPVFYTKLDQLAQNDGQQTWQIHLCPRGGNPFLTEWQIAIDHDADGEIATLRIGVYGLSKPQVALPTVPSVLEKIRPAARLPQSPLPQSLDGLQVLVVEDEADIREFLTAVLEAHGVGVRAVASVAAALEAIEHFHPDVLVSDIRMPHGDGYSLIRQIRAIEAAQGGHIPAAAITAYLEEDREKALSAGFEAHLHKLAQPTELIQLVAQLAQSASSPDRDLLN
ncbi:response regulator [Microcoleus sp. FACHB-1515]|uniref:response regulator n=1 Tax=Cyanophyceae TaxID=3028117 RepID=UPI00168522F2|nr:response regulator [Microcoleus sp. FACHB-1515]MBD2091215.1 response regulator [Microcoleus sp. FACHB-1515]